MDVDVCMVFLVRFLWCLCVLYQFFCYVYLRWLTSLMSQLTLLVARHIIVAMHHCVHFYYAVCSWQINYGMIQLHFCIIVVWRRPCWRLVSWVHTDCITSRPRFSSLVSCVSVTNTHARVVPVYCISEIEVRLVPVKINTSLMFPRKGLKVGREMA